MTCAHDGIWLTPNDVKDIFHKSYITAIKWLGARNKHGKYMYGEFTGAFKCNSCGKIFIPVDDVDKKLQEYEKKARGVYPNVNKLRFQKIPYTAQCTKRIDKMKIAQKWKWIPFWYIISKGWRYNEQHPCK